MIGAGYRIEYVRKAIAMLNKYYILDGIIYKLKKGNNTLIGEDIKEVSWFHEYKWSQDFYDQFIRDLDPDTQISIVDCHI